MLLYKPGFDEETLSEVEKLIEKTEKICALYNKIPRNKLTEILKSLDQDEEKLEYDWKNETKSAQISSDSVFVENILQKSKGMIVEEKVSSANLEDSGNYSEFSRKKKNSLLKRTASEPKLTKIDSTPNDLSVDISKEIHDYNTENSPNVELNIYPEVKSKKTYKEKIYSNNKESKKEEDDSDSPYNEIFFYNFENVLIDYIKRIVKVEKGKIK